MFRLFISVIFISLTTSIFSQTTINVPADYSTIQQALNAASQGDTVLVQPGTYYENIFWPNINGIKLIGLEDNTDVILDGSQNIANVIYFNTSTYLDSTTQINNFIIQGGSNITDGGGLYLINCSAYFNNLQIRNCSSTRYGGGIFVSTDSSPLFQNLIVSNCLSEWGGGVLCFENSSPSFQNIIVKENTATRYGGGVCGMRGAIITLDSTIIIYNNSQNGGGIGLFDASRILSVSQNFVVDNSVTNTDGGGVYIYNHSDFYNFSIINNEARYGGAICVNRDTGSEIRLLTIVDNKSTEDYDGIYFNNLGVAAVHQNNFLRNGYAVNNTNISVIQNCTDNYWGDASGPYQSNQNPGGDGDSTNLYVDVVPWLVTPNISAPPIPPYNLQAEDGNNESIIVNWNSVNIGDLAGYKLFYDTDSTSWDFENFVVVGLDTTYTLANIDYGDGISIAVTCYDTEGNESWFSKELFYTPPIISPTNLSAGSIQNDAVFLNWEDNSSNESGFKIERKNNSSDFIEIDSVISNVTDYTDDSFLLAGDYFYRVRAFNNYRYSDYSNIAAVAVVPVELVSLTVTQKDNNVLLCWITRTETNNYRFEIERKVESDTWGNIGFVDGNGTTTEEQFYSFTDAKVPTGKVKYRLKQIDYDGSFEYSEEIEIDASVPFTYSLMQNFPNPFNPTTTIRYEIPEAGDVKLFLYNVLGEKVKEIVNSHYNPGRYEVKLDGTQLSSGVYYYMLTAADFNEVKKLVLIK